MEPSHHQNLTTAQVGLVQHTAPYPDPKKPFVVKVDHTREGVVLSQHQVISNLHPCALFSKKLIQEKINFDIGNCELLAIKIALEEWRHWYLFTVLTDHKNLELRHDTPYPDQACWIVFFTRFNLSISYRPGSKTTKADTFPHKLLKMWQL